MEMSESAAIPAATAPAQGQAAPSIAGTVPTNTTSPAPVPEPTLAKPAAIDPKDYPDREGYAKALLESKLHALTEDHAPQTNDDGTRPSEDGLQQEHSSLPPAEPDHTDGAEVADSPEVKSEEDEPSFELETEVAVTPEGLSEWIRENEEFASLLEADPRLKGQLYKTAREAAELAPYREIFPDLESAKSAQSMVSTFSDVRESFLRSTTREGTMETLARIAALSYEQAEDGSVLMKDGNPIIGEDFFAFVDNVVGLNLEHRTAEIEDRLNANVYRSPEDRERDEAVKAALDILREEDAATSPAKEDWPEQLKRRQEALDRREDELNLRHHRAELKQRSAFEHGLQVEARKRIGESIDRILSHVEKQGAMVSPYLKNILPQAIGAKLVRKVQANPMLQAQMRELQRLPPGDQSGQRRLAAIDRAIQQYLPQVAREELREAGVQIASASAAKQAKIAAQIDTTRKTEPKGSTGPAGAGKPLTASAAFEHAQAEWQRSNPGRRFDNSAKEEILPRVLQLMSTR